MPRAAVREDKRLSLRIKPRDKAKLMRASALAETDMSDFIVRNAVRAAEEIIERAENVPLSRRDSQRVLELLEHPPMPNARLTAAARTLPASE
ncbi:MAG: DUF1778 domain-containing protein [Mesorhizobium sp.]